MARDVVLVVGVGYQNADSPPVGSGQSRCWTQHESGAPGTGVAFSTRLDWLESLDSPESSGKDRLNGVSPLLSGAIHFQTRKKRYG